MSAPDFPPEVVEVVAQTLYGQWRDRDGWVPWTPRGNSVRQDEARHDAREILRALPALGYQRVPDGYVVVPDAAHMTDDQAEAIAREARCCGGVAYDIYRAALAAAPRAGTENKP